MEAPLAQVNAGTSISGTSISGRALSTRKVCCDSRKPPSLKVADDAQGLADDAQGVAAGVVVTAEGCF